MTGITPEHSEAIESNLSLTEHLHVSEAMRQEVKLQVESQTWRFLPYKLILAAATGGLSGAVASLFLMAHFNLQTASEVDSRIDEKIPPPVMVKRMESLESRVDNNQGKIDLLLEQAVVPLP